MGGANQGLAGEHLQGMGCTFIHISRAPPLYFTASKYSKVCSNKHVHHSGNWSWLGLPSDDGGEGPSLAGKIRCRWTFSPSRLITVEMRLQASSSWRRRGWLECHPGKLGKGRLLPGWGWQRRRSKTARARSAVQRVGCREPPSPPKGLERKKLLQFGNL